MNRRRTLRIDRLALSLPAMSEADARMVVREIAACIASRISGVPQVPVRPTRVRIESRDRGTLAKDSVRAIERAWRGESS